MTDAEMKQSNKKNLTGSVKWFNNKSGYGFITTLTGDDSIKNKDIFVHHSSIRVKDDLYKYLVQGEYVEFNVQHMESQEHVNQAVDITGVLGGDLMCETRHKNRDLTKNKDGLNQLKRGKKTLGAN